MKNLFYIFFFSVTSLFAQGQALFDQATKAYSEGNYEAAIENYEQILDGGQSSVAVYYNLANAHYKLDHVAPSIYYYEKALQLRPNDEDVKNNLAFAQKMTIDAIVPLPKTGISKWMDRWAPRLNFDAWAWTTVVFSVLFALFILGYYFAGSPRKKRLFFIPAIGCLLLGIASFVFANFRQTAQETTHFAIVFAQVAEVKSAPNLRSNLVFSLHEGTKVEVMENFGDWLQIELPNRKQGWIKKEMLKQL